MRFLLLTDTHIRGTNPQNRKDNFMLTLLTKLEEVMNLVVLHNVDYVLHNGDIFDRPDVAPSIVREFALVFKKCPVPIYGIIGNHDIYAYNPDTVSRTMLGLIDSLGMIRLIGAGEKVFLEKGQVTVQLTGQPFHYDIDRRNRTADYCILKDSRADYALHMVHGMLLKRPFFEGIPYTLIDDILDTEADVTFSGHYHGGYNLVEVNNKYFVNPGSLVRINNSLSELSRHPQVAIVDFTTEGIGFEFIKLKTALPGEQVLDREGLCRNEYREKKLIDFTQGIKSVGDVKVLNIQEIVEKIANESQLSRSVVLEAIKRISAVQENTFSDN
jgi:exonuclease SbcD